MSIFGKTLQILFPEHCIGCHKPGVLLCESCAKDIPPLVNDTGWISSCFSYQDPRVHALLHALKYKHKKQVASIFAPFLYDQFLELRKEITIFAGNRDIVLIPIPMSGRKKKKRGYNQAELLTRALASHCAGQKIIINIRTLVKNKETIPQAHIKERSLRIKNAHHMFAVKHPSDIAEKIVIIIDDITTTGATLDEAKRVLVEAGASSVYAITVAH